MDALDDFGNYPEINSAGLADFYVVGERARFVLFDWYRVDGVFRRRVVGTVTQLAKSMQDSTIRALQQQYGSQPTGAVN